MTTDDIRSRLFALQDVPYRDFQAKLIPTVDPETMIGVRTPALRQLAKELAKSPSGNGKAGSGKAGPAGSGKTASGKNGKASSAKKHTGLPPELSAFLSELPHRYFDENQLHAFLISEIKDFDVCIAETERFLPYIDNWATCDQMSPKIFRKHRPELLPYIRKWIVPDGTGAGTFKVSPEKTYIVRFGTGMLMEHFLDDDFDPAYPELVSRIRSGEYYVNMMTAWYFATALAKQYDAVLPYLTEKRLDPWVHNKTIQKAVESFRITPEQKAYLKTLRRHL